MKKLDYREKQRHERLAELRHQKNLVRQELKLHRRRYMSGYDKNDVLPRIIAGRNAEIIKAPIELSIYGVEEDEEAYKQTISFIEEIRSKYGYKSTVIDFSSTMIVKAPAVAAIYAAVETSYSNGEAKARVILPKDYESKIIIVGLHLKKIIERAIIQYDFSQGLMPVISGTGMDYYEDVIDFIQRRLYMNDMPPDTEHKYGDAVSEAINNVGLHAYPGYNAEAKKWWLLCHVNLKSHQLYLVLYDLGVGIPTTIVQKNWFIQSLEKNYPEEFKDLDREKSGDIDLFFIKRISDATKVGISMTGDVSGTKQPKHGQGSKSFKALVNETQNSSLLVYSGYGMYKMKSNSRPQTCSLPKALNGTVVQWNIDIS